MNDRFSTWLEHYPTTAPFVLVVLAVALFVLSASLVIAAI